jgi:uncharacterized protein (UPF0262 family)
MTSERHRIVHVDLDEKTLIHRKPEVEHERAIAIYDLLEQNRFSLREMPQSGPFRLFLSIEESRLLFDLRDEADQPLAKIGLPLAPFRGVVRDYFLICESYHNAIRRSTPSQIEAIDMGRRSLHNEGSQLLKERLSERIDLDDDTARRLFTLLCVLHIRA